MSMEPNAADNETTARYWTLVRDVSVLQVKLVVDGFRDLLLVPASLIAALVSLLSGKDGRPGPQLYQLLLWGRQTEKWINLFGAANNAPDEVKEHRTFGDRDIDDIVSKLETLVVDEAKRDGITRQAKERLDSILRSLQQKRSQQ